MIDNLLVDWLIVDIPYLHASWRSSVPSQNASGPNLTSLVSSSQFQTELSLIKLESSKNGTNFICLVHLRFCSQSLIHPISLFSLFSSLFDFCSPLLKCVYRIWVVRTHARSRLHNCVRVRVRVLSNYISDQACVPMWFQCTLSNSIPTLVRTREFACVGMCLLIYAVQSNFENSVHGGRESKMHAWQCLRLRTHARKHARMHLCTPTRKMINYVDQNEWESAAAYTPTNNLQSSPLSLCTSPLCFDVHHSA